jgi:hypothetical protein
MVQKYDIIRKGKEGVKQMYLINFMIIFPLSVTPWLLGSTQSITVTITRNFPRNKGRPARKADNLIAICEPTDKKVWELQRLTTIWASSSSYKDSLVFFIFDFKTANERHTLSKKQWNIEL